MTKFRPCIDLHNGQVKQIVGATLGSNTVTNYTCTQPASYFAKLYKDNQLTGAHVIQLGPGNEEACLSAIQEYNLMQVGGGIDLKNAQFWISKGADKVIVTSYLFTDNKFNLSRLQKLTELIGKDRLVIDLSCRAKGQDWYVATNKWQTLTTMKLSKQVFDELQEYCCEFLIHAADVEGLCSGIDERLVKQLGEWCEIPITYAGGARTVGDLDLVEKLSGGKVDLTIGRYSRVNAVPWIFLEDQLLRFKNA